MANEKICKDCSESLEAGVAYCVGDVSGDIYCMDCAYGHVAVTTIYPEEEY